jgi:hypothetical protein
MDKMAGATGDPHPCIFNILHCQTAVKAATDPKRVLEKLPNLKLTHTAGAYMPP